MTHDPGASKASTQASANLHQQCRDLLSEVDEFQDLLRRTLRNPQLVEVRQFRSSVNSELRMVEKLIENARAEGAGTGGLGGEEVEEAEKRLLHVLRSSNLPFHQAVWGVVRSSCVGLVTLGRRVYWDDGNDARSRNMPPPKDKNGKKVTGKDKRKSVLVDVVADDGEEWVKVSTMSESRLLFEMAEKGWERDSEDEFSDGEKAPRTVLRNFDDEDSDEEDELELIKLARGLRKAADATLVRYRHPRLRIVLPKIEEGNVPGIDEIVNEMRSYGVEVQCRNSLRESQQNPGLDALLPRPFKRFTPSLNVDCTLLLAAVSDLSHVKDIPVCPGYHRAVVRQIEGEKHMPLLPAELWPAMRNRELLCTSDAAARMLEIVNTIGTDTEKTRTKILMGKPPYDQLDQESLIEEFQKTSDHSVPNEWKLPIKVSDAQPAIDAAKARKTLPPVAYEVSESLSDINHSVFMYGWATGITTISSNRTIDKQIENTIEKKRNGDRDLEGPNVWVCDTARSLVGKEKNRKE
ncbi:Protein of unknown function DUF1308 [Penicillium chermesinum]|uniref:DUF1308 domain-containing protein n=1 Tax=Penicillium chermesinum TaxID=63820 RepID=A0A9W9PIZ1_9EURO|nr:Protein of unknown function DUF1308 [Penicillium chermesinum]KAJ5246538.1 Protein of unknown function DUF1308 [Penicillium chermesinum]